MSVPLFRVDDGEGSWGAGRTAWGHGRTKKVPADEAALLPVDPKVRTRPGALANFRLCANNG
jgi:hypothetical protein